MTLPILPEPIAAYFAADTRWGEAVADCFTNDATVVDERRTHKGLAAIKAWKTAASAAYTYTAEPIAIEQQDRKHVVTARVAGNFPGSPVALRFAFILQRGKIAFLEIAP